ncbi:hypothetical protein B0J13DRAFT_666575 [Dactylonectria estremocensis]|uniref:Uncharacterized protein n=1 Tax=Dactylonectria estremocensis TaxID=1079267 RepID=A0A9P9J615_9HYPO|nr:hypothetical protein B0J13DRAFT_666575 [Dactylonectria estremocensis]
MGTFLELSVHQSVNNVVSPWHIVVARDARTKDEDNPIRENGNQDPACRSSLAKPVPSTHTSAGLWSPEYDMHRSGVVLLAYGSQPLLALGILPVCPSSRHITLARLIVASGVGDIIAPSSHTFRHAEHVPKGRSEESFPGVVPRSRSQESFPGGRAETGPWLASYAAPFQPWTETQASQLGRTHIRSSPASRSSDQEEPTNARDFVAALTSRSTITPCVRCIAKPVGDTEVMRALPAPYYMLPFPLCNKPPASNAWSVTGLLLRVRSFRRWGFFVAVIINQ